MLDRLRLSLAALALAGILAPAMAQETADPAAPSAEGQALDPARELAAQQQALEAIEASISLSRDKVDALKAEIAAMQGDRAKQNAALIAAGQRVKMAEIEVNDIENRLAELIVQELEVRGRLDGADQSIASVLAALERISLHPPPALIVDPSDALGSARGAILISAILPQLQATAAAVKADLEHLTQIKAQAQREEATLKANYAVLEEEQLRIATLILARKQGAEAMTAQLAEEEQAAADLAAKATSVKDLIAALESRAAAVAEATQNPAVTPPAQPGDLTPQAIRTALANAARSAPAIPFAAAKGFLQLPAGGEMAVDFGAGDGFGGISQGVSLTTRPQAQVVAPADGWVMYKGPYLNYGQIIILNPGDDYTILLAGLDAVSVNIGQFVLMGEPVGTMGSQTIGRTVATSAGGSKPTLYIELRQHNAPMDPTGWWDPTTATAQANTTPQNG